MRSLRGGEILQGGREPRRKEDLEGGERRWREGLRLYGEWRGLRRKIGILIGRKKKLSPRRKEGKTLQGGRRVDGQTKKAALRKRRKTACFSEIR